MGDHADQTALLNRMDRPMPMTRHTAPELSAPTLAHGALARGALAHGPFDPAAHRAYLMAFARSRLGGDSEVEDLVQETILAAWQAQAGFRGESAYRTWLTSILAFKIVDHRRRAGRSTSLEGLDDAHPGWLDAQTASTADPLARIEARQSQRALHAALQRLPAMQRDAWLLTEFNELPTAALQRILGVSADNAWVLLHRARKRLQAEMRVELAAA
jgi:RNA polymerase sigma-70 factor, ECF subfamily